MKLTPPLIDIPCDEPFKYDVLGRVAAAETLTNLLTGCDESLVIAINAPWGFGKTTFVRMLRQHLENNKIHSIYLNAWENDFSSDSFVTLLGDIDLALKNFGRNEEERTQIERRLDQAKTVGKKIIKAAIPAAVKLATSGIIDLSKESEDILADTAEKIAEQQIQQYEEARKSVAVFREKLSELGDAAARAGEGDSDNPIVIFVDELDRCRPTYAISYLESVKHFFAVPNIVFILSFDRVQLGHSIKSLYGSEMDVDGYLRRFVDIELNLPAPDYEKFVSSAFTKFGLDEFFASRQSPTFRYDKQQSISALTQLGKSLDLSLRELERACTALSLAARSTEPNFHIYPLLLMTLIGLKIKNPSLYNRFLTYDADHKEILKYLQRSESGREFVTTNYGMALEAHLASCRTGRHRDRELASEYTAVAQAENTSPGEKERARWIADLLEKWDFRESFGTLGYLTQKIDLLTPRERS